MSKVKIIGTNAIMVYGSDFDAVGRKAAAYIRKGYDPFSDEYTLWQHKTTGNQVQVRAVTLVLV
jgi:hypothetical protein